MDEFEYSVEICDRDWQCFFAECEECNILPPSLAGLEDSGMSDMDDAGSVLAKKAQRVDLTPAGFSVSDCPIDGPPDCEGSPVEHYLSKHGIGGIESVLSGSEEDIHLQSVNVFFESLKSLTEAKASQVKAGKNKEAVKEEEQCSVGQQASANGLPKNIPKLNGGPARVETAVGKETMRPVDTIRNINAMKKMEPAASTRGLETDKSAEIELFIREDAYTETCLGEVTRRKQSHDSSDRAVCSAHYVDMCKLPNERKQEETQFTFSRKLSPDLTCDVEMGTDVKWREEQTPNATSTNKAVSRETSPSASIKRKRRKKRRLSAEPGEGGYERQLFIRQSDSEEGEYTLRGGAALCLPDIKLSNYFNEPQQSLVSVLTPYSTTSHFSVNNLSIKDMEVNPVTPHDSQHRCWPESAQTMYAGPAENYSFNRGSVSPTDDSANVATHLQPCNKLDVKESTGLNTYSEFPVLFTEGVTVKSNTTRENQTKDIKAESLQQSDKLNHSVIVCYDEPKSCTTEVKSESLLPSAESNAPAVEVSQKDKLSTAKSVLAEEAENSGRDKRPLRQREAEPQQQLEIHCHNTDRYSTTLQETHFSPSAAGETASHALNVRPPQVETRACPLQDEIFSKASCTDLSTAGIKCHSNSDVNNTEPSHQVQPLFKLDIFSDKAQTTGSILTETDPSQSEDLLTSPSSDITHVSSCCTLDSVMSLSNETHITDMSASFCSSVSEHDSGGEKKEQANTEGEHATSEHKSQPESKSGSLDRAEDAITVFKAGCEPGNVLNSVFAMSSFWSEMEKLTINDILGLRRISQAAPPSSLPPLQEREETDMFADSGFFSHAEESKPETPNEDTFSVPDSAESSLNSANTGNFSSSRSVTWESEPVPVSQVVDIYPENMSLTSVTDAPQPVPAERAQKGLRKISKNISLHNLHALESESLKYTLKSETLQTLDEEESEQLEHFTERYVAEDKGRYSISLSDIFQYLFGEKQSVPSQSTTDNITTFSTDGNSVPETYDLFFSEFDTESFFNPLHIAEEKAKDKTVPIFSCSRSANRNLQYPEAYDYFFASSSSDDSSVESDEEEECSPVRVVTRFTRKSSSSQIYSDMYDHFFTDGDLGQNFFWKTTFSFRNVNFTASTVQKQESNALSLVPVRESGRYLPRTVLPLNALGNQDTMFPDPLLFHLEERISCQLARQPFSYDDIQTTLSNPRLDASFLPLKQSDMCLVCIAFASWVLKTANPQIGDAWKAVLLANVSALSAIRYLRKYVKMEAVASETKLNHPALTDS
ncbi:uncharacterized protein perm1a [Parambassis ranga]|uniref:Uncharacterized protein perm1a n=1 Tax=Parambassis ranga TaxID=210632 RepID=A0A6P7IJJ4_9TELE|nr:PGC-1 and ERR-induced regulator in muscle protein 1 [Parambassis ranga]